MSRHRQDTIALRVAPTDPEPEVTRHFPLPEHVGRLLLVLGWIVLALSTALAAIGFTVEHGHRIAAEQARHAESVQVIRANLANDSLKATLLSCRNDIAALTRQAAEAKATVTRAAPLMTADFADPYNNQGAFAAHIADITKAVSGLTAQKGTC